MDSKSVVWIAVIAVAVVAAGVTVWWRRRVRKNRDSFAPFVFRLDQKWQLERHLDDLDFVLIPYDGIFRVVYRGSLVGFVQPNLDDEEPAAWRTYSLTIDRKTSPAVRFLLRQALDKFSEDVEIG